MALEYKMKQVKGQENSVKSHNKHPFSTTQETILHMDITKGSIKKPNGLYFCAVEDGEAPLSQQNKTWS